ncbi:MAG TPA: MG2 domain-containing protein [Phycisphaerae bacterium]|nr:MG2 domain-containing protein [Phycisphaerae bacterium]
MQTPRGRITRITAVLSLGLAIGGAGLLAAPSPEELLSQAKQQYERHNYKQAAALCQRALDAGPAEKALLPLRRLQAMSHCKLRDNKAQTTVAEAVKQHPALEKDPDFLVVVAEYDARRGNVREAYERYVRAAELYEKAGKPAEAADAWFGAVAQLQRNYSALPEPKPTAEKKTWTWQERQRLAIEKAVEICEHIATLKVDGARKGRAMLLGGQVLSRLGDWPSVEKGIALWRRCVKEFGTSPSAPQAQYEIASALERFGRFVEALGEYAAVIENYPNHALAKQARVRIESIKAPQVLVSTDRGHLPGEKVKLHWRIRNLRKVHLTAWRVDLVEAARKQLWCVNDFFRAVRDGKGEPVAEWAFPTPDEGKHQFHLHHPPVEGREQTTLPIDVPLEKSGAYLVRATGSNPDGKSAEGYCLVLLSKLAAVAKADGDQIVVLATDSTTGAAAQGADVAAMRQYEYRNKQPVVDRADGKVDDGGLCELKLAKRRNHSWLVAVRKGAEQALVVRGGFRWYWWGYGNRFKVYGFTERPVYRPKQTVHFKEIIRLHDEGTYTNYAGKKVHVTIRNPKGETVYAKDHVTDEYGAVEGSLALAEQPPLGVYYIEVKLEGNQRLGHWYAQGNQFRVEEYKKPEFQVTVEPGTKDYRVGDEMKIKIAARYYFGQPVADAEVKFTLRKQSYTHHFEWPRPWDWYFEDVFYGRRYGRGYRPWWRPQFDELVTTGTIQTDGNGEAFVTVKAEPIKGHEELDLKFVVDAEVTDSSRRVIRGQGEVKVTHAPFFIHAKPAQAVYQPADSVEVNVKTEDPNKKAVAGDFDVEAWRVERIRKVAKKDGRDVVEFEEKLAQKVFAKRISVPETGRASIRFVPDMTGHFKVIVREASPKAGRKPVEGACELWIASRTGAEAHYAYSDLKLIPASDQYEIGQTLKVLVNTSKADSRVLLTAEADDLLIVRVVHVARNSQLVELPVTKPLCPNFTLTATLIRDNRLFMDSKEIVVPPTHRFLKIDVKLDKGSLGGGEDGKYQPREKTKVRLTITDRQTGRPVVGQVALMMVDSSVYYIQPEFRDAIEKAFYGHTRQVRVSTMNSFAACGSVNPSIGPDDPSMRYRQRRGGPMLGFGAAQGGGGAFVPAPAMAPMEAMDGLSVNAARAPMAKGAAPGKKAADEDPGGGGGLAETIVRSEFRDTVLWAGTVETDADGRAAVDVTLPDQLTTFALHAIAVDKDTRVGQAQSDVITTKRIIARLESGRFFTEGDHSYVTVIAHNYFEQPAKLLVDLGATDAMEIRRVHVGGAWRDYKAGDAIEVTVPGGGEQRLDFLTTAVRPGEVVLTARVRGERESDAIRLTKPIVPWGASKIVSSSNVLAGGADQSAQIEIVVPAEIKAGSQSLTVLLNPSVASVAVEALPFLAAYPYGCVEQTMSRFLPTVLMRKTLQEMGADLEQARRHVEQQIAADPKLAGRWKLIRQRMHRNPVYDAAEVDRMIAAGLKRLADLQHPDGSWGWWKHDGGNAYMTAYVLFGLTVARDCDVKLPDGMLDRGAKWLAEHAAKPKPEANASWWTRHIYDDNTRVYALHVLGRIDAAHLKQPKLADHLDRLYKQRDELSDYGRAFLALALHAAGRKDEAKIVVENFQNTVDLDEKVGTAGWGQRQGWWYWYQGADETTAWVLQAMMTVAPESKFIPMAVKYLVRNRRGVVWGNTKSTATAVFALARYAKAAGELDCDQTFEVTVGGVTQTVRVTKQNMFSFDDRVVLSGGDLAPGKHTVQIRRKGKGALYWAAHLTYFTTAERIQGGGNQIAVRREYFRLVPEEFQNTRRVWKDGQWVEEKFLDLRHKPQPLAFGAEVASGELVEVQLTIDAENNFEYLVFEDPKPSGCEPYRLVSGHAYGGGTYANMELRDTKVVFFANWLSKGKHDLKYKLVCEQPGTFRVLPSRGEAMYTPFVEAISDSGKIVITTKPVK